MHRRDRRRDRRQSETLITEKAKAITVQSKKCTEEKPKSPKLKSMDDDFFDAYYVNETD